MLSFETFLSPFSWRYGSDEMRSIWSEVYKRKLWRRLWVALAEAQSKAGLVTHEQVEELRSHSDDIDINRAHQIEAEIQHDLMAEVHVFADQCPKAGGVIHLGATSMDIEDNADALRLREAIGLVVQRLENVLTAFCEKIKVYATHPCMGYTHLQPAEPTTIGYRLSQYAQDLHFDLLELRRIHTNIRGKGFKGAVGTSASYHELLAETAIAPEAMEAHVMQAVGLQAFLVATQTYPRKQDWLVLNALAGVAGSIYKFALDLRILQSPSVGEWSEPFGKHQVGSSAMPFKRNPIRAEKLCSLGRMVVGLPQVAWDNASQSILERTLDDSANRRSILPEAFLAVDEMLHVLYHLIKELQFNTEKITRNLEDYGTFSAIERLLMALGRAGANRQAMHEILREHSMVAWQAVSNGQPNPLVEHLCADKRLLSYFDSEQIKVLMSVYDYVGDAPQRALKLVQQFQEE